MDAAAWDDRYREEHAGERLIWSREPNVFVAREVADLAPGRALDLAAGEGRNAIWLAQRGWDVEAVDFSQAALDRAAALATEAGVSLTFTRADVTDPSALMLEPADLVLVSYLQLPRELFRQALRFAASLVAPAGTLLLVAHAKRNLTEGVGGPPDPEVLPDLDEVLDDLDGTGLAVVKGEEVERPVELDGVERAAIDLLLRAERPVG